MKNYSYEQLLNEGYTVSNALITKADIAMTESGYLTFVLSLDGGAWVTTYGGYAIGKGYLGAPDDFFAGSDLGLEAIIRIMNAVGVESFHDFQGKYVRVAFKDTKEPVTIIGNVLHDTWFDVKAFFEPDTDEAQEENSEILIEDLASQQEETE